jgi:ParB family chromosome partitioning protein
LDALLPASESALSSALPTGGVTPIPVANISPNPRQPRARFDPEELAELAASIKEHGIIQPLIVARGSGQDQFILIAGERRLLAARSAGLEEVPAIIRDASEQQLVELALVENVQRADLSPLEAAEAFRQLNEEFNLSHEDIAARVGKSRTAVTNTLRLLRLPLAVQQALAANEITEGHARALLTLPTPQAQAAALERIVSAGLNVRQTEELVRRLSGQKPEPKPKKARLPEFLDLEERLRGRLGTRVTLNPRRKGGTLVIHYYSDEELNAIIDQILGGSE